ncbi:MAG: helix-turn-helix transcriptional regulator, partial [Candidatus Lokiarchaeota archaeon]|nr:helix-turn-helix transcriptional regulator [Candidatus Lokiarchaeota archaeon]
MIEKHNIGFLEREHYNVQKVMEIAEEIIDETKFLNVRTLQKIVRKRLKLPRTVIIEIIELLLNKKYIIEGSKHTRKTIMYNDYRRKIYNIIINNNGMNFSLLRENVFTNKSGSTGQLIWHLKMLIKFKYIKKIKIKNATVFIPIDMEEEKGRLFFFLKDKINREIIKYLNVYKQIKRSEIHKNMDEKRQNVYYRLNLLLENNIILFKKGSDKMLCISPDIKKIYNKIIESNQNQIDE